MTLRLEIRVDREERISLKAVASVLRDDETGELVIDFESMTLCYEYSEMGLRMTEVPYSWKKELEQQAIKRFNILKHALPNEA